LDQLIKSLDDIFVKKAPVQLPNHVKEWIVKYGPIVDLVLLVLALPIVLAAFAISVFSLPFVPAAAQGGFTLVWFFVAGYFLLRALALPGLFARKKAGWNFLFYAALLNLVGDVLTLHLLSAVVGTIIWFYFLFQIRSKYH